MISVKNFKTRCEGLSPALFFFAICGNVAFGASILAKRMDLEYLVINASWLAGKETGRAGISIQTDDAYREPASCGVGCRCEWVHGVVL
jgi:hypothetical protein